LSSEDHQISDRATDPSSNLLCDFCKCLDFDKATGGTGVGRLWKEVHKSAHDGCYLCLIIKHRVTEQWKLFKPEHGKLKGRVGISYRFYHPLQELNLYIRGSDSLPAVQTNIRFGVYTDEGTRVYMQIDSTCILPYFVHSEIETTR
jgi:hypothetical protein